MAEQSRIIIIGGGAIGCSIAYHLAKAGEKDVLLLEKAQLTQGSTWHAAGLVGQLRSKHNLTRLMQNSVALYDRLEEETGQATDWKKVGSIRIASTRARLSEIRQSVTQAKSFGFDAEEVSASEARKLFPFMDLEGVVAAAWIPSDGYIDPYALTQAYARGARQNGATIRENVLVTGIRIRDGRVVGVDTDQGPIDCEILVNCAGIWAKRVGEMAGLSIAAGVVEHQYMVTEKTLTFDAALPTLRDPDRRFYVKPDVAAFAVGGFEQGTKGCWRGHAPFEFGQQLFETIFDRFEQIILPAAERIPVLNDTGIRTVINGPISVSADGEPIMGPAPELENMYLACGFTSGIAASGGAGEAMSNWILEGDPGMDLWSFDARRFGRHHGNWRFLEERAIECYGRYYAIHWPAEEHDSGRDLRLSPLHGTLKHKGAVYGSKFGWERPNWFKPKDSDASETPSFEGKPGWFDQVGVECSEVASGAALIDQSSFSKFEVAGAGAWSFLNNLGANRLPKEPGHCTYSQFCNTSCGIESDLTIMQPEAGLYYVVTGSAFGVRDRHWMKQHLPEDGSVQIRDITSQMAVINICGPRSREILAIVSDDDVSNAALPCLSVREIQIGGAAVWAARVGYVGELGWELHLPVEVARHVYQTLWQAGVAFGIADVGYRAIESLRLEKGYVYWSADVTPDHTPLEAGLAFCVDFDKGDFIGRDALAAQKAEGVTQKLCTFSQEGFTPLHSGDAIMKDGKVVGRTTSAGYGHRLGQTIAFGYVPAGLAGENDFQIETFGNIRDVARGRRCLYDPKMERLRG